MCIFKCMPLANPGIWTSELAWIEEWHAWIVAVCSKSHFCGKFSVVSCGMLWLCNPRAFQDSGGAQRSCCSKQQIPWSLDDQLPRRHFEWMVKFHPNLPLSNGETANLWNQNLFWCVYIYIHIFDHHHVDDYSTTGDSHIYTSNFYAKYMSSGLDVTDDQRAHQVCADLFACVELYTWRGRVMTPVSMAGTRCKSSRRPTLQDGLSRFFSLRHPFSGRWIWVCLKIGYIPNYSHLIGIMIINHWNYLYSDTPIWNFNEMHRFFQGSTFSRETIETAQKKNVVQVARASSKTRDAIQAATDGVFFIGHPVLG